MTPPFELNLDAYLRHTAPSLIMAPILQKAELDAERERAELEYERERAEMEYERERAELARSGEVGKPTQAVPRPLNRVPMTLSAKLVLAAES